MSNDSKEDETIKDLSCFKCQHIWRKRTTEPLRCPKCHTFRWRGDYKNVRKVQEEEMSIPPITLIDEPRREHIDF